MTDSRTFTLIGKFDDQITSHLESINKTLGGLKRTLNGFAVRSGGFDDLTKSIGKVVSAHKVLNKEVVDLRSEFSKSITVLREYRSEVGKATGSSVSASKASVRAISDEVSAWQKATLAADKYKRIASRPISGGGRPPLSGGGPGRPPGGGGGVFSGGHNITGDIISGNLISNAIISGFQVGVGILQQGMNVAFNAFAERAKDQMEDIGAAGGIYAAFQYNKMPGGAKSFQQALEMQDDINKKMAAIASNLPGTTHDYVENSRRLVDTTGQVMARDFKGFTDLAKKFTGDMNISGEKAFAAVNVEIAKSTTMLEKANPTRSVVPMTQLVEDMIKDDKVTIGGLRKYVSFRRSTTFEAALNRHLEELNATGAGTAKRLEILNKILREAVPAPMVNAARVSVAGVVEGFRSAFLDPDVGLFGLSRTLFMRVAKFNAETGERIGTETTNFFKMFAETFGRLGNLLNTTILPGIAAVYSPFEGIAKSLVKLREAAFKIYERQQSYTQYYDNLAQKFGMSGEGFKTMEKGGLTTVMDMLRSYNMLSVEKYNKYAGMMAQGGSEEQISGRMKDIYKDIIPTILASPIFKDIGKEIAKILASVFKEIAHVLDFLLHKNTGGSVFTDAFAEAGGMKAINDIIVYLAEALGKALMALAQLYIGAIGSSLKSGNLAAAGLLALPAFAALPAVIGGAKGIASGVKGAAGLAGRGFGAGQQVYTAASLATKTPGGLTTPAAKTIVSTPKSVTFGAQGRAVSPVKGFENIAFNARKYTAEGQFYRPKPLSIPVTSASTRAAEKAALMGAEATAGAAKGLARFIPGVNAAIAAIDFSARRLAGESVAKAGAGAAGATGGAIVGGVVGQTLIPIPVLGAAVGSALGAWLGDYLGSNLGSLLDSLTPKLNAAWESLRSWFVTFPETFGGWLGQSIAKIGTWLQVEMPLLWPKIEGAFSQLFQKMGAGIDSFMSRSGAKLSDPSTWGHLGNDMIRGVMSAFDSINLFSIVKRIVTAAMTGAAVENATGGGPAKGTTKFIPGKGTMVWNGAEWTKAAARGSGLEFTGSLGSALNFEMANKPSGSKLVIANSSETVIPAAGGLGMGGLVDAIFSSAQNTASTMSQGFSYLQQTTSAAAQNTSSTLTQGFSNLTQTTAAGNQGIISTQKQTASQTQAAILQSSQAQLAGQQQLMVAIQSAASAGGVGGAGGAGGAFFGGGGAGSGSVIGAGKMLLGMGLQVGMNPNFQYGKGYLPGGGGYIGKHSTNSLHYSGRALDVSGTDAQLDAAYAKLKTTNPTELLWRTAGHFDHLHVAYALGAGNPAFFKSQTEAQAWEKSMVPSSVKVGSITSNSAEGLGGQNSFTNNITIHQQPGQDAEYLAAVVVQKMGEWVSDARSSSIFV